MTILDVPIMSSTFISQGPYNGIMTEHGHRLNSNAGHSLQ